MDTSKNYAICVLSCFKDKINGTHDAIMATWGKDVPSSWDLRIFMGGSSWIPEQDPTVLDFVGEPGTLAHMDAKKAAPTPRTDLPLLPEEVVLPDAPDTYLGLAWKGQVMRQWAIDQGYQGVFIAMADTFIRVKRLVGAYSMRDHDVVAQVFPAGASKAYPIKNCPCPHGGHGYWLSRKAMMAIAEDPVRHYSEDQNVAFALHAHNIPLFSDGRLNSHRPEMDFSTITLHLSTKGQAWDPSAIMLQYNNDRTRKQQFPSWDGMCHKCGGIEFKKGVYGPRCLTCGSPYAAQGRNK